jgi:hypothetical protein
MYKYSGVTLLGIFYRQLCGAIGLVIATAMVAIFLWGITIQETNPQGIPIWDDPRATLVCFALWFFIIGYSVSLSLINFLPSIWLKEEGVSISAFIFGRIFIPWSDILEVRRNFKPGYDIVLARHITVFHRMYGWLYAHTWSSCFIINHTISDYEVLIRVVSSRAKRRSIMN